MAEEPKCSDKHGTLFGYQSSNSPSFPLKAPVVFAYKCHNEATSSWHTLVVKSQPSRHHITMYVVFIPSPHPPFHVSMTTYCWVSACAWRCASVCARSILRFPSEKHLVLHFNVWKMLYRLYYILIYFDLFLFLLLVKSDSCYTCKFCILLLISFFISDTTVFVLFVSYLLHTFNIVCLICVFHQRTTLDKVFRPFSWWREDFFFFFSLHMITWVHIHHSPTFTTCKVDPRDVGMPKAVNVCRGAQWMWEISIQALCVLQNSSVRLAD